MINFTAVAEALRYPTDERVDIVIDSDAYNEVDDQFAIAWALRSTERLNVEAVYAAPFCSLALAKMMPAPPDGQERPKLTAESLGSMAHFAATPADGMEQSYNEILHLFELLGEPSEGRVFRGSATYIEENNGAPVESDAARDLIRRAMSRPEGKRLYVLAIGTITNVASALMMEPAIADKITVVWLGGQPPYFKSAVEFNLMQDVPAAQHMFDCGVPLVLIPCTGVASHLTLTKPELELNLIGKSDIASYLGNIVLEAISPSPQAIAMGDLFGYDCGMNDIPMDVRMRYMTRRSAPSRIVWDISTVGYLMSPNWAVSCLVPSPVLRDDMTWGSDPHRHPIRLVSYLKRDSIFGDLFDKLGR